ncbi:MAG: thiol-disulfide isomerase [Gammaproteobacteria bacterium]|nr:thiol-disulfide isomerase [Gammaproteobacteria bacterium]MCY4358888.1 thiol-disulfide isomerase [Gammaproteobacteria bacterium]
MDEALIVSNVLLWLVVVVLALLVFALTRQVGILHERIAPAGALQPTNGPKVGELTTAMALRGVDGGEVTIGGEHQGGLATFVLFISPSCPVCKSLVPTARSLVHSERNRMRLVFASDGAETPEELKQHADYVSNLQITAYPYVISQALGLHYQVSKLPFALLISSDGTLKSKGLVNTREHMESLIEAMDSGISTVQEFTGKIQPKNAMEQTS